jgi:PAS domain S-box-containing protein
LNVPLFLNTPIYSARDYQGTEMDESALEARTNALAFCITDSKGVFVEVNEAYCQLYGYSKADLVGQHFTIVVPQAQRAAISQMQDAFIQGTVELPGEWIVVRKDGMFLNIHFEALLVTLSDGQQHKMTIIEVIDKLSYIV